MAAIEGRMDDAPRVLTIRGDTVVIWGLQTCSDAAG
jgi:hypothetical protein